jgi:hypothetical protein
VDLLDLAILALRLALVAVLYVFLLAVLRASGRTLQATRDRPVPGRTQLRLIVLEAGGSNLTIGEVIDVSDAALLGRAERAEVVISDSAVSAEHAHVSRSGKDWVISDLGSTNGTLVNESRVIAQARLNDGDVVGLGGVRLQVGLRSASAPEWR